MLRPRDVASCYFLTRVGAINQNIVIISIDGDNFLSLAAAIVADAMRLIDIRTCDGSRQYLCLPRAVAWNALRDHAMQLPEAEVVNFVGEGLAQAWLDFVFRGHRFLVRGHDGQFHFFVRDPHCPDLIVYQVARHFKELLMPT